MSLRAEDYTGKRFGKLLVLNRSAVGRSRNVLWTCQCDCGKICEKLGPLLRNGHTKSCGCGKTWVWKDHVAAFWKNVDKTGTCWLWTGDLNNHGYGVFYRMMPGSRKIFAHRNSWILHFSEIPSSAKVLHKCDTPACVNPDHLFLGSQRDNIQDMLNKGRNNTANNLKGEDCKHAKLTEKQVMEIRRSEDSLRIVADQYGISKATASNIRRRNIWKHVQ